MGANMISEDFVKTMLPVATGIAAGVWAVYQYLEHRREVERQNREQSLKETRTRQIESRKPFLELQLRLYVDIAQVNGMLSSVKVASTEWKQIATRFWALYWSELCMVESKAVEETMSHLKDVVKACEDSGDEKWQQQICDLSLLLAHQIRYEIETAWSSDPATTHDLP
jgi:hypothetical protein